MFKIRNIEKKSFKNKNFKSFKNIVKIALAAVLLFGSIPVHSFFATGSDEADQQHVENNTYTQRERRI